MINYYEYIDDYIAGSLSDDLKADFEKELINNPKLKHAVDNYNLLKTISAALVEDETRQVIAAIENKGNKKVVKLGWLHYFAAASFLGILLYTSFFIFRHNQDKNILALYKKPVYDANRSEIQDIKAKQDSAILYFELNRIEDAKTLFLACPPNDTTSFFLGHIQLQKKNYARAIEDFSKVDKLSPYFENAKYHLVLLYLLTKDTEKAEQLYRTLLNADDMKQLSPFFK